MEAAHIKYFRRNEIDDAKWNACIDSAANGLVYAYTDYLDCMSDNWDGLVLSNYEAVMPLPWRKKWGVHYIYQPFLTAQLGIFAESVTADLLEAFLQSIPKKFSYWDASLNHQNLFPLENFSLYQRSNYTLSLNRSYEELHKNYRENIRRNIKKSKDYGCVPARDIDVNKIIGLAKMQSAEHSDADFENFKRLFRLLKKNDKAKTYGVVSKAGELLASCVFLFSHNRAYYILVGNHPNGRTLGASHALIDAFIRDHANQNLLLDFEGSDIRNLAFFYSSFGAAEEKYAAVKFNRLPWWMKWAKK
ncbi:MAG: GNAT family N-acetyltransferase [Chitinophagaceae bacterium]|nr:MAG: GNAT family N-acetyltransferase [Chitinophagaceae bacterium]